MNHTGASDIEPSSMVLVKTIFQKEDLNHEISLDLAKLLT